ncbi:hypothetical protein ACFY3J_23020 [Streptomyces sp. NPDC001231]|uniref:hypothetical protein n=1 Tax=unclassified Streptomyces TaxID=2593676 RepID=UPI0036CF2FCD
MRLHTVPADFAHLRHHGVQAHPAADEDGGRKTDHLRLVQGFAVGGEGDGAILIATKHASQRRRAVSVR